MVKVIKGVWTVRRARTPSLDRSASNVRALLESRVLRILPFNESEYPVHDRNQPGTFDRSRATVELKIAHMLAMCRAVHCQLGALAGQLLNLRTCPPSNHLLAPQPHTLVALAPTFALSLLILRIVPDKD